MSIRVPNLDCHFPIVILTASAASDPLPSPPGTSPGADLNLSLDKVLANRNLTNKLWNAGKFILNALQDVSPQRWQQLAQGAASSYAEASTLQQLPLAERWIVSELHQVS